MKRIAVVLVAATVIAACAHTRPKLPEHSLEGRDFPFKSGLRVFVQQDRSAPLVTTALYIGSGGSSDPVGLEGLAHVAEHMLFRARYNPDNPATVMGLLDQAGIEFNAYTDHDSTVYLEVAPADRLDAVMDLAQLRLLDPLAGVTEEDFRVELEVVRSELRQRTEGGGLSERFRKYTEWTYAHLFPKGHAYHQPVIGTHESLSSLKLSHVKAFVRRHYRPDNATLVIVGDVDLDEVAARLGRWAPQLILPREGLPPGESPLHEEPPPLRLAGRRSPPPDPLAPGAVQRYRGPVDVPTWLIAWSIPGQYQTHSTVLGQVSRYATDTVRFGLSPVRRELLRHPASVRSGLIPMRDASVVFIEVEMRPYLDEAQIEQVLREAMSEIDGTMRVSSRVRFRHREKDYLQLYGLVQQLHSLERVASLGGGRAARLAPVLHNTGDARHFSHWMEQLSEVGSDDIREIVERYIRPERAVFVLVTPDDEPELVEVAHYEAQRDIEPPGQGRDAVSVEALERLVVTPGVSRYETATLRNGLTIIAGRHGDMPLVQVGLIARGGSLTSAPPGLPRHLHAFTSVGHEAQLAAVGGTSYRDIGATSYQAFADAPAGNIREALERVADLTMRVRVRDDYERYRISEVTRVHRELRRQLMTPGALAAEAYLDRLYPDHPLSLPRSTPLELLEQASSGWARTWVEQTLAPGNSTLIIVGDIDPRAAIEDARRVFGWWRGKGVPGAIPAAPPPRPGVTLVHNPAATQTRVSLGCRLPDWTPRDLTARSALSRLLRRELYRSLRERRGATYGVAVHVNNLPGGISTLHIEGNIDADHTAASLALIRSAMAQVAAGDIDRAALVQVLEAMARSYALDLQTNGDIVSRIMSAVELGLPVSFIDDYAKRLAAVDVPTLTQLMGTCAESPVIVLEGNADKITPELEAAWVKVDETLEPPSREQRNAAHEKLREATEVQRLLRAPAWL